MRKAIKRRITVLAGVLTLCVVAGTFAVALPADAHIVSDVDATCAAVTVDFDYFPDYPVPVTIVVQVAYAPVIVKVFNISDSNLHASVPISSVTSLLTGQTVPVRVEMDWVLHGNNHVVKNLTVTCGSGTTTTHKTTTTQKTTTTVRRTTTTVRRTTTTIPRTTTTKPKPPPGGDIFQVELRRCTQVHEGYRNFPAGTVVYWKVKQNGTTVGKGNFKTLGGKGYHFITQNIGKRLKASPVPGDIHYRWKIGGVTKTYFVRRAAGCSGTAAKGTSALGNIFVAELRKCRLLHAGYQFFPGKTSVSWLVSQGGVAKGIGKFVTTGGNNYHFLSPKLAKPLKATSKASVTFLWKFKGVVYKYAITRSSGC
jgi:hypothetical protein